MQPFRLSLGSIDQPAHTGDTQSFSAAAAEQLTQPKMPPNDISTNLHQQIMIQPNFLTTEMCDQLVAYIQTQPENDLTVFSAEKSNQTGTTAVTVEKEARNSQTVPIEPVLPIVTKLMREIVRDYINPFYGVRVKDSELPKILIYHPGGHFKEHIDSEALFNDGSGVLQWRKNVDRDISLMLYLNDDFVGGELEFIHQAITIKPRKGMMVAFPSDHRFLHGVKPVTRGTRYAMVEWFSLGKTMVG